MFKTGNGVAGLVFAAVVSVIGFVGKPAFAAGKDAVPPAVASKLAEGSDVSGIYSGDGKRHPVIIELRATSLPDAVASDSASDAARISAIHGLQNGVLLRLFGNADGIARAASSSDHHLKRMDYTPFVALAVNAAELDTLAADPDVVRIQQDRLSKPSLIQSLPLIGMPNVYAAGGTGEGFAVAVLDTGGRRTHEFLSTRIVQAACFSTTDTANDITSLCPGGASQSFDTNSANDCDPATTTGCGHGTHVAGIVAGFNTNLQGGEPVNGVARNARIISINVFSRLSARCDLDPGTTSCVQSLDSDQLRALEYVYGLRNAPTAYRVAAVNISIDFSIFANTCDHDARRPIIDMLRAANIATVVAAGNETQNAAVGAPGCISSAITVASSTKQDVRSASSNWGNMIDVVAPGSDILSSYVQGNSNTFYKSVSGTSMAAPMVAGAFAALRTLRPNATVDQIETALKSTGLGIMAAGVTKPRIRVAQALAALPPPGPVVLFASVAPVARATRVGSTVTALATVINAGGTDATGCSIALPAGTQNVGFTYRTMAGNTFGPVNVPTRIRGGNTDQNFLMTFTPGQAMSRNLSLVFDCDNSTPAPSVVGLNTFLLTAQVGSAPADVISTAATSSNDGILSVPLGAFGVASFAAINIGSAANLTARVSTSGITEPAGPETLVFCRTNPSTAVCLAPPTTSPISFTATAGQVVTFTVYFRSTMELPFDPANRRLFMSFLQGATQVGSASVAIRVTEPIH